MSYCGFCGTEIRVGEKFCPNCGTPVEKAVGSAANVVDNGPVAFKPHPGAVNIVPMARTKNQIVAACPCCGAGLTEGTSNCSSCGYDLTADFSGSVKEFEKFLIWASSGDYINYLNKGNWSGWNIFKKIGWVALWIMFFPLMAIIYLITSYKFNKNKLKPDELRRANIVENFVFAADRDTTIEALYFIKSQIDQLENISKNSYMAYWVKTWRNKATQIYQRSITGLGADPAIKDIYDELDEQTEILLNKSQKRYWTRFVVLILAVMAIFGARFAAARYLINRMNSMYSYNYDLTEPEVATIVNGMNQTNTISKEQIQLVGILDDCFEVGDSDAELKLMEDEKLIQVTFELVCKKEMAEDVKAQLESKGMTLDPTECDFGDFVFNSDVRANIGNYGVDKVAGLSVYKKMLEAQPGDTIPVKLYAVVEDYSDYSLEKSERLMKTDNLIMGAEVSYYENEDYITIK